MNDLKSPVAEALVIVYRQYLSIAHPSTDMTNRTPIPLWFVWTLLTVFAWGVWAFLNRLLADAIASPAHGQLASTIGIVPVLVALYAMPDVPATGSRRMGIWLALASGIVSCLGNIANLDLLGRGAKAAAVIPLTALYPVVTILLAVPILRERVSGLQWLGIATSLLATYLFNVSDETGMLSPWLVFALGPIVLWGVCGLLQKMATNHISARLTAIWFLLSFLPVAAVTQLLDPLPTGISAATWLLAAAVGLTLALGNLTVLLAFECGGSASIITPMCGLYPLVGIPIAIQMFGEQLRAREWIAIVCALAAIVLLSFPSRTEAPSLAGTGMETIH